MTTTKVLIIIPLSLIASVCSCAVKHTWKIYMGEALPHKLFGFPFSSVEYCSLNCPFLGGHYAINYLMLIINFAILFFVLFLAFYPFYPFRMNSSGYMNHLQWVLLAIVISAVLLNFILPWAQMQKCNIIMFGSWILICIYVFFRIIQCWRNIQKEDMGIGSSQSLPLSSDSQPDSSKSAK